MHSQGKWSILYFIPKRKFHFISIFINCRTSLDSLEFIFLLLSIQAIAKKLSNLLFFDFQLLLVWKGNISTSATDSKMWTWTSTFQSRYFICTYKTSLCFSLSHFIHNKGYFLSRKSILYNTLFFFYSTIFLCCFYYNNSFIRKIHSFHNSCIGISFFHNFLPFPNFKIVLFFYSKQFILYVYISYC